MFGTTITIKFQNKLAREAILDRLKSKSKYMFEDRGLILRSFLSVTDTQVKIFMYLKIKIMLKRKICLDRSVLARY